MVKDSSTSIPDQFTNCPNKLPCGVCMLTNKQCPLAFTQAMPTWTCSEAGSTATGRAGFSFQKEN